jgi:hypothetical protein
MAVAVPFQLRGRPGERHDGAARDVRRADRDGVVGDLAASIRHEHMADRQPE